MSESNEHTSCACGTRPKLFFSCSGAADVGEIADKAARKLTADGVGQMFCLAGIGGRVSSIMATTKAAGPILAIDGCSLDCARNTLEQAGFTQYEHLRVSDLDMEKGQSPATDERIGRVVREGRAKLVGARQESTAR